LVYVTNSGLDCYVQVFSSTGTFIRKFGATGIGNGEFLGANGIDVDAAGFIYVTDGSNDRIQVFNSAGAFVRKWGIAGRGDGLLNNPQSIELDMDNNICVLGDNRFQVFTNSGSFVRKFGCWGNKDGEFAEPPDIAVDVNQQLYLLDKGNFRVQVFDQNGRFVRMFGAYGQDNGQFVNPNKLTIDHTGNIYVTDNFLMRVQVFDNSGLLIRKFGSRGTADGQFSSIAGICTDATGNIYVTDQLNNRVQVFDQTGQFIRKFGSTGTGDGQFNYLGDITVDPDGNIYVTDRMNFRVQVFDRAGNFVRKFGSWGTGTGQFASSPGMIAVGEQGKIYVTDNYGFTQQVEVFNNNGNYLHTIGSLGNGAKQFNDVYDIFIQGASLFVTDHSRVLVFPTKMQEITFGALPVKQFDDPAFQLEARASSGLPVYYKNSYPAVATVQGNTVTITQVGTTSITAYQPGNNEYAEAVEVTQVLTVNKGNQAITFPAIPDRRVSDGSFTLAATSSSGLPVSYTSSNTSIASVTGNRVTVIRVGTVTITARQFGNDNYLAAPAVNQTFVIRHAQTINFPAIGNKTFGDADFELPLITTSAGLPVTYTSSNEQVATLNGNIVTITGAGTVTITARNPGNNQFAPVEKTQLLTVEKAVQTLSFVPIHSKKFGEPAFNLEAVATTGLPVSFVSSDPSILEITGNTVSVTGTGTVFVFAIQYGNINYYQVEDFQEITVAKGTQSISFDPFAPLQLGVAPVTLQATASSNLPVVYTSSNPLVAVVTGNIITVTGVGTTQITANQPGNENYEPAIPVTHNLIIDKVLSSDLATAAIYPNPVRDVLYINMSDMVGGMPVLLEVRDMTGRLLKKENLSTGHKITISSVGLKPGMYFISLTGNGRRIVTKIIRMN
jgi:sugar lactone lactonase YvrE